MWRGIAAPLAGAGLRSLRPSPEPSPMAAVGEGDPAFSAGRGLMGPSLGVCRVRLSPLPAAPPWRGGGAELPRAGAGRAPRRVRAEGWR